MSEGTVDFRLRLIDDLSAQMKKTRKLTESSLKSMSAAQIKLNKEVGKQEDIIVKLQHKLHTASKEQQKDIKEQIRLERLLLKEKKTQLKQANHSQTVATKSTFNDRVGTSAGQGIGSTLMKGAGALGIAYGANEIVNYTKDAIVLAGAAEGVRAAFEKLNKPDLLKNLTEATRGTVSDIDLMKAAVKAKNFKIPLDQLATYFDFATKRAGETGESVDYLVSSIIDGIGRKSPLILDNLGISASALKDEFEKTGDFAGAAGNIINSELSKMGPIATTAGQKIAGIGVFFDNLKVKIGSKFINIFKAISSSLGSIDKPIESSTLAIKRQQVELNSLVESIKNSNNTTESRKRLIEELNNQYPGFLKNLDVEKVTNDQLQTALNDVNKEYEDKINLLVQEELYKKNAEELVKLKQEELNLIKVIAEEEKGRLKASDGTLITNINETDPLLIAKAKNLKLTKTSLDIIRKQEDELNASLQETLKLIGVTPKKQIINNNKDGDNTNNTNNTTQTDLTNISASRSVKSLTINIDKLVEGGITVATTNLTESTAEIEKLMVKTFTNVINQSSNQIFNK